MSSCGWFHLISFIKWNQKHMDQMGCMSLQDKWLVVSTPLKNISQNGNLPQVGVNIKNMWNHHLDKPCLFFPSFFRGFLSQTKFTKKTCESATSCWFRKKRNFFRYKRFFEQHNKGFEKSAWVTPPSFIHERVTGRSKSTSDMLWHAERYIRQPIMASSNPHMKNIYNNHRIHSNLCNR